MLKYMRVILCQIFKKKAGPQGACNKMYKSLESTCLHYPEFRTLVSWADTTICNAEEMTSICLTFGCSCQRITLGSLHDSYHPQTAPEMLPALVGIVVFWELAQEHWGEGQQGAALPWLTALLWVLSLWVTAMLFHWCWLRNNSVHTISTCN